MTSVDRVDVIVFSFIALAAIICFGGLVHDCNRADTFEALCQARGNHIVRLNHSLLCITRDGRIDPTDEGI